MDFASEQKSRSTIKALVGPAVFMAGWIAAAAMFATGVGSPRSLGSDIEDVLSASLPVETASESIPGLNPCTERSDFVQFTVERGQSYNL
jgi:hypothetical protein